ncbi:dnaJ homolog subfamily C member 7-like [Ctenocephalides felis]|uniref:dnaJ homolog subfamily C member 7-like n=1 Tax=Ctenocephalides felis TaxID=7515 RepID=UPI000E6E2605|nr:dnaJ homolog subfamily C member 7-like [Ctenocephalides felis]
MTSYIDDFYLAEAKKEIGNDLYKEKNYHGALQQYSKAIVLYPDSSSYYGNRAACYMMLFQYKNAMEDAKKAVVLDPNFAKAYLRIAKCSILLGDFTVFDKAIEKVKKIDPTSNEEVNVLTALRQQEKKYEEYFRKKDFKSALNCIDKALNDIPTCDRYKVRKAECLASLGCYQESQKISSDILMFDKSNIDANYVHGICLYYQANIDEALKHFQRVLKLAPDHVQAMNIYKKTRLLIQKKKAGNDAFNAGKLQEAHTLYTKALDVDPQNKAFNSILHFNKATVLSKQNKLVEAIVECMCALELDENYLKALLRKAKCYGELGFWKDAVMDYEKAYKMNQTTEIERLLNEAKVALEKSKPQNYYKTLGIPKNATNDEIKTAYRRLAKLYHPDRYAHASNAIRKEQEKKFKEVGEAYDTLSDPQKRYRYDQNQDFDEISDHKK